MSGESDSLGDVLNVEILRQDPDGHSGKPDITWQFNSGNTWENVGSGESIEITNEIQGGILRARIDYTDDKEFETSVYSIGDWLPYGDTIYGSNGQLLGKKLELSADGLTIAANHSQENNKKGGVTVYDYKNSTWSIATEIDGKYGDWLGYGVAISADGDEVAAGSPFSDKYGSNSGKIDVYDRKSNSEWDSYAHDIPGEEHPYSINGSKSGYSVDIDSFGLVVAAGEPNATAGGSSRGKSGYFN